MCVRVYCERWAPKNTDTSAVAAAAAPAGCPRYAASFNATCFKHARARAHEIKDTNI